LEILKRAREFQSGEGISAFESESNVREEVNRRSFKAGYTDRDGQPRSGPKIRSFGGLGENRISTWPRDEQGNLIGD